MGRLETRRMDLGAGSGPSTAPGVGERSPEPGGSRERARRGQAENGPPGRRRRLVWAAGVLVALVLFGLGAAVVFMRDPAEPVAVDEVVERFRDHSGETSEGSSGPREGVYLYATTGSEDFETLGGSHHDYPERTAVTVTTGDAGCLTFWWDALTQRWESRSWCPARDGSWSQPSATTFHSFFNVGETRSATCDAEGFVPPPAAAAGEPLEWTCNSTSAGVAAGGPSLETGTGTVVGHETVTVAGRGRRSRKSRTQHATDRRICAEQS